MYELSLACCGSTVDVADIDRAPVTANDPSASTLGNVTLDSKRFLAHREERIHELEHRQAGGYVSRLGVVLLAFGEPEGSHPELVIDFLERIFLANRRLEPGSGAGRARQLAEARAPGLMEAYEEIGGSPMNAHARAHGEALEAALKERGNSAHVFVGTQFTTPTISDALQRCRESGVEQLVALPLYPVSGPTTTVAALDTVREELDELSWLVETAFIGGWHRNPKYVDLRADGIRTLMTERGLDAHDPGVCLYFSAHGTPISYLEEGSQYQAHVEESCRLIADGVGVDRYELGYQNHTNRAIEWDRAFECENDADDRSRTRRGRPAELHPRAVGDPGRARPRVSGARREAGHGISPRRDPGTIIRTWVLCWRIWSSTRWAPTQTHHSRP